MTGVGTLVRFIIRRDRVRIVVWVLGIVVLLILMAASVKGLYKTQADLDEAAAAAKDNPAAIAFNGPVQGLDTIGGEVAFQGGSMGLAVVALMSVLMVGRLTRGEEEAGRVELLRALPVGARAPSVAAMIVVAAMNIVLGALIAVAMLGEDLPATGSVVFGMSFTLVGLLFAGVALVAAQATENTRVVYGSGGALIGAAFVIRAVGDIGDGTASWFSPIGWAQKTRPWAGEAWWPFVFLVVALVGAIFMAARLSVRRDLGGGLMAPRPGHPTAAPTLGQPLGLAVRLQRGTVIGWSIGILATAIAYGSIAPTIDDFVGSNQTLADILARAGGASLTDSYLATSFRLLALVATGFAVQAALRVRSEETALYAEPVLATPTSRWRWAASHLTIAFGGTVVVLVVAGIGVGGAYAIAGGGLGVIPRQFSAALVYAPAMWLMVGLAAAFVGLAPRAVVVAWMAVAGCLIIGVLGELLSMPGWLETLSPFEHVPELPAAGFSVVPLLVLTAGACGLTAAGLAGLRRRDIG